MTNKLVEEWVISAEQELGVEFPDKYKNKMLSSYLECSIDDEIWTFHPFFDKTDRKSISSTCNHVLYETKEHRSYEEFPPNAVAIAGNGDGDSLILMPDETNPKKLKETIYIFRHDEGAEDIVQVAESIDDLEEA